MTKLYAVKLTTWAIVVANDGTNAVDIAIDNERDILRNAMGTSTTYEDVKPITSLEDVKAVDWDGFCIPYNTDRNSSRLGDLLK